MLRVFVEMTFWPDSFRSAKSFFDEMTQRRVQLQFQTKASPTDFLDQAKMDKKQMIGAADRGQIELS